MWWYYKPSSSVDDPQLLGIFPAYGDTWGRSDRPDVELDIAFIRRPADTDSFLVLSTAFSEASEGGSKR